MLIDDCIGPFQIIYNLKPNKSYDISKINSKDLYGFIQSNILHFYKIYPQLYHSNLQMSESRLPEILSNLALHRVVKGKSKFTDLLKEVILSNPLNFDRDYSNLFYRTKIQNFLIDSVLGLNTTDVWDGRYFDAAKIFVFKENKKPISFLNYNLTNFKIYLLNNTILEQSNCEVDVFQEKEYFYLRLNLQIRFI